MFHDCEGQSYKTVSTDHNFWRERRAEADSNRGPSAYQPNALPLGQTGSPAFLKPIQHLYTARNVLKKKKIDSEHTSRGCDKEVCAN